METIGTHLSARAQTMTSPTSYFQSWGASTCPGARSASCCEAARGREWTILRVEATEQGACAGRVVGLPISDLPPASCPHFRRCIGAWISKWFLTTEAVELLRLRAIIGWSRAMESYRPTIAIPMCTR